MSTPAQENGIFGFAARSIGGAVSSSRSLGRAKRAYGQELKAARKLEAARERRQVAERAVKMRREETATRKRDDAARKAAAKREQQDRERAEKQQRAEQDREHKAQQRERDKEEAAHRKAMLQEQAERKREAQIEERERRAIAAAEERERKSYAGRMRRRPTYSQSEYEMNPARQRKSARQPQSLFSRIGEAEIAGIGVADIVGAAGGVAASRLAVKVLPLGAPGSWTEIGEQLLLAYGLHVFAPESVRAGMVVGALASPIASVIQKILAGDAGQSDNTMEAAKADGITGAARSEVAGFEYPPALPEASPVEMSYPLAMNYPNAREF